MKTNVSKGDPVSQGEDMALPGLPILGLLRELAKNNLSPLITWHVGARKCRDLPRGHARLVLEESWEQ